MKEEAIKLGFMKEEAIKLDFMKEEGIKLGFMKEEAIKFGFMKEEIFIADSYSYLAQKLGLIFMVLQSRVNKCWMDACRMNKIKQLFNVLKKRN